MKERNILGLMLSVMLLLLPAGSGLAHGPQTMGIDKTTDLTTAAPWYIETVDSTIGVGTHVSVAIDPDSNATYISYYDAANKDLKVAKYVGTGGNCGTDSNWSCETIDSSGDAGKYSSIAIDPTTNLPAIAYWAGSDLKLASAWNGGWDIVTIDSGSGGFASLKVDSTGAAHIAYYYSGGFGLVYAKRVGGGTGNCGVNNYQCDLIDDGFGVGQYPSLALDGSDQPRIAYYNGEKDQLWFAQPGTPGNCGPGDTWGCSPISSGSDAGLYASLAVDNSNLAHIAYYDSANGKLMYAAQVGTGGNCGLLDSWQCDAIANMGTAAFPRTRDVALAVDQSGLPIIVYSWYYGAPFSTRGFSWARPVAALGQQSGNCGPQNGWQCTWIQDGTYSGDYSAIAVNSSGLATIAYSHGEFFSTLRVAYQKNQPVFLPLILKQP